MNYSLYLIGSKARGDDNVNSDVDYVCIYDKRKPLLSYPDGSISYYSTARMKWMVENSKLFVKHLITEGQPIFEKHSHRELLLEFQINPEILQRDYVDFVRLLFSLLWIPPGTKGLGWGCDYIYTVARNIIYIDNALAGYYSFGYSDAVKYFLKKRSKNSLISDFLEIREGKYSYRNHTDDYKVNLDALNSACSILTNSSIHLEIGGKSYFPNNCKINYETLRLLERAIVNGELPDNGFMHKLQSHGEYFFSLRKAARDLIEHYWLSLSK